MSKKIQLGKSDLFINPIGLGTNYVGGHNLFPEADEAIGKKIVQTAIDHDVNFVDTAFSYGYGRSEELIGEVVKSSGKRDELILATKGAQRKSGDGYVNDNSPAFLRETVENSLKRLKTDYIDLFYIHSPDEATPKDEAVGALKELKDEGKIRAIGVSNFSLDQLKEANKDGYVDVFQGLYNLLNRGAETDYFPYTVKENISFVPFFPLSAGLLTGKYNENTSFNDFRPHLPDFQEEVFKENLEKVDQLKEIANAKNVEVANLVVAWYLHQEAIDTVIPGAKRPEQLLNNLKALEIHLTEEERNAIHKIFE